MYIYINISFFMVKKCSKISVAVLMLLAGFSDQAQLPASLRSGTQAEEWPQSWSIDFCTSVTDYHKPGGWKQQGFILPQFWRPGVQTQGVDRVADFFRRLWGRICSTPLRVSGHPWQSLALLDLQMHHSSLCLSLHIPFSSVPCVSQISLWLFIIRLSLDLGPRR